MITLRGMTWNHTRGFVPLVAAAQRFSELNPEVRVAWDQRSLRDFEQYPVERLAAEYDLIVIDHPFVGYAAKHGTLLPLEEYLPPEYLADQARHSVGASHASYTFGGHQWALAVDAAAPVALWREDLLARFDLEVPRTWEDVQQLAGQGRVEIPAAPINCLMNFYALCLAHGEEPFQNRDYVVGADIGCAALAQLRALLEVCEDGCWQRNPIASHERLARADNVDLVYCPLAYGYSNYAREGYAAHRLIFGSPPSVGGAPLRTTLGGTGLAVSASRPHQAEAVALAAFTVSEEVQRTLYTHAGGQPGHRSAWLDPINDLLTRGYFRRTLPALDQAYLRPRYCGYVEFQDRGGPIVHAALRRALDDREALKQLDALYRETAHHAVTFA